MLQWFISELINMFSEVRGRQTECSFWLGGLHYGKVCREKPLCPDLSWAGDGLVLGHNFPFQWNARKRNASRLIITAYFELDPQTYFSCSSYRNPALVSYSGLTLIGGTREIFADSLTWPLIYSRFSEEKQMDCRPRIWKYGWRCLLMIYIYTKN